MYGVLWRDWAALWMQQAVRAEYGAKVNGRSLDLRPRHSF